MAVEALRRRVCGALRPRQSGPLRARAADRARRLFEPLPRHHVANLPKENPKTLDIFGFSGYSSGMSGENQHVISGLLQKRSDLERENADCRERMAIIANDIEAIDRVLDAFEYQGPLEGRTPRAARIILFYRNELRQFLQAELQAGRAAYVDAESAQLLCQKGRNPQDRRVLLDVAKRASKALREMRGLGIINSIHLRGRILSGRLHKLSCGWLVCAPMHLYFSTTTTALAQVNSAPPAVLKDERPMFCVGPLGVELCWTAEASIITSFPVTVPVPFDFKFQSSVPGK